MKQIGLNNVSETQEISLQEFMREPKMGDFIFGMKGKLVLNWAGGRKLYMLTFYFLKHCL